MSVQRIFQHWSYWIAGLTLFGYAAPTVAQCEVALVQGMDRGNLFGGTLSLRGDLAVVGDPLAFDAFGAAFVYRRGPGGVGDWQQEAVLMAPKPFVDDQFGQAVAACSDIIIVGAPHSSNTDFHSGAAYVFRYDSGAKEWMYETNLVPLDGDAGDVFGWSVSVDGNLALIGARDDENDCVPQSGSAYVFRYEDARWVQEAKLTDPESNALDLFGVSSSIRGDVGLVGAHGKDHQNGNTGSAFVFHRNDQAWELVIELEAFDTRFSERFGFSVSLGSGLAVVGAYWDNNTGTDDGSAYVYRYDREASTWLADAKLTASDAEALDWFGWSVSVGQDGKWIVVGAVDENTMGFEAGAAYLFESTPHGWQQVKKLTASDGGALDHFGAAVSVDREAALIGAPGQSQEPGIVYVFDLDSITADLDCDGMVGAADLLILLTGWGPCEDCDQCLADLDQDCSVGASDLLILLANWG